MTRLARLRRFWLDVHLWIGVGLLALLIPVAVSGAALVWHDGLERVLHPARRVAEAGEARLPLTRYAEAAREAFGPQVRLTQIRLPDEPGAAVVVTGRQPGETPPGRRPPTLNAWIHPATGQVLDVADPSRTPVAVLHRLHGSLMIPGVGRKVVGWLGWAMFVSCATGLWLWWPRNGAVVKGLRWRRGPSTLFNLHHTVGFWICIPLAVLSLTGVYISFPQTSRAALALVSGQAAPEAGGGPRRRAAPEPLPAPRLDPQTAAERALSVARGEAASRLSYPTQGRDPAWQVQVGATTVTVRDADGTAHIARAREGGGRDPAARLMRRIHDGQGMGLIWRTVIFLGGIAPAVLGVTGVVMWLQRRARRRAITRTAAAA